MTTLDRTQAPGPRPRFTPTDTEGSARLGMTATGTRPGALDGAWWPRTRDLAVELRTLLDTWQPGAGPRAMVHPAHWQLPIVRRIRSNDRVMKVSSFAEQDPHKLILLSRTSGRWDLLVIPPETDEPTAARLMAAAAEPGDLRTASALLAAETGGTGTGQAGPDACVTLERETQWESEGGPGRPVAEQPAGVPAGTVANGA